MLNALTLMSVDDSLINYDTVSDEELTYLELDMLSTESDANELLRTEYVLNELQSAVENDLSMESSQYAQLTLDCILGKDAIYIDNRRYDNHLIDVTMESDERGVLRKIWDAIVKFANYIKNIIVKLYTKVADFFKGLFGKKKETDDKLNDAKKSAKDVDNIKADDVEKETKKQYDETGPGIEWNSMIKNLANRAIITDDKEAGEVWNTATKKAIEVTKKVLNDKMYAKGNKKYDAAMKEKRKASNHFKGLLPIKGDLAYIYSLKQKDFEHMSASANSNNPALQINVKLGNMTESVHVMDIKTKRYHKLISKIADDLESISFSDMADQFASTHDDVTDYALPAAKYMVQTPMLESNLGKAFLEADNDAAQRISKLKSLSIADRDGDQKQKDKTIAFVITSSEYNDLLDICTELSKAIDTMSYLPKLFSKAKKENVVEVKVDENMPQDKVKEIQAKMRIYNHMVVGDPIQLPVAYLRTVTMAYRRVVNLLHEASTAG